MSICNDKNIYTYTHAATITTIYKSKQINLNTTHIVPINIYTQNNSYSNTIKLISVYNKHYKTL